METAKNAMQPEIRAAIREDFADIARLMQQVHDLHSHGRPDIYKEATDFYTLQQFTEDMEDPELLFLVAVWEGKPVGMCQVKYHTLKDSGITKETTRAYVEALCVQENCQNHGIGKQLLQKAEEEGKRRKSSSLELTAWEFNEEVLEFYKNYGMKIQRVVLEKEI